MTDLTGIVKSGGNIGGVIGGEQPVIEAQIQGSGLPGIVQGSGNIGGMIGGEQPVIEVQIQSSGLPGEVDYDEVVRRTSFRHEQQLPLDTWHITHGLGFYPSVFVADSGGNWVVGEITYHDENSVTLKFNSAFSGEAYFS